MESVLHLARMMAELHLAEYEGARIAKISWRKEPRPEAEYGVHFQKHGNRFLRMACCETKKPLMGEISMSLILGKEGVEKSQRVPKKERMPKNTGTTWRCFSYAEVLSFVAAAGDENSIHRQEPAIVPGMLILQKLLTEWPMTRQVEIRFFHPLYCGEELHFLPEKDGCLAVVKGERKFFYRLWKSECSDAGHG